MNSVENAECKKFRTTRVVAYVYNTDKSNNANFTNVDHMFCGSAVKGKALAVSPFKVEQLVHTLHPTQTAEETDLGLPTCAELGPATSNPEPLIRALHYSAIDQDAGHAAHTVHAAYARRYDRLAYLHPRPLYNLPL